jgi:hypothetical protein
MCGGDGGGMKRTTTILTALIALHLVTGIESAASEHLANEPVAVIQTGSAEQVENVAAALELFAEAGLELPPIDVYLHADDEGCDENLGLYTPGSEIDRIDVCTDRLFITLHEFAHAWENRSAKDEDRQELLDGLELEAWTGGDVHYRKRGIEAAANLIAWGLIAPSAAESGLSPDTDRLDLFASFTGVAALRYVS